MLRISGGEWRGRRLKTPPGDAVRPTQEKVREAVFSMLQNDIPGADVLDLYSGSGSLGLEALSRGAARATFVDCDRRHLAVLKENATVLGAAGRCEFACADAEKWVASAGKGRAFKAVFADPPYALGARRRFAGLLALLAESGCAGEGCVFTAEMKSEQTPDEAPGWTLCRDRAYGHTRIAVYVKDRAAPGIIQPAVS